MAYAAPRLPKDASPEMREQYTRHLLKALAAGTWGRYDETPVARYLDAHPETLERTQVMDLVQKARPRWWPKRWWRKPDNGGDRA